MSRPAPVSIVPMQGEDLPEIYELAARTVGPGYYGRDDLREALERSRGPRGSLAFVARLDDGAAVGFRFTYPPGRWEGGRGQALHPERWGAPLSRAAYFQSCFVDPAHMGRGIGRRLAERALRELGATAAEVVVAHSWKESPHGSSRRYLESLGFSAVAECADYWIEVDYICPRCGPRCRCTALEMVRPLVPGG